MGATNREQVFLSRTAMEWNPSSSHREQAWVAQKLVRQRLCSLSHRTHALRPWATPGTPLRFPDGAASAGLALAVAQNAPSSWGHACSLSVRRTWRGEITLFLNHVNTASPSQPRSIAGILKLDWQRFIKLITKILKELMGGVEREPFCTRFTTSI